MSHGETSGSEAQAGSPLASPRFTVKYFLDDPSTDIVAADLIRIFHRWIRDRVFPHELMLDVADYGHVARGPGVMLVCVRTHYSVDLAGGRPGVRYARKRDGEGTPERRLKTALRSALQMARMLEEEPALLGRYRFRTDEIEFGICDRLCAPNTGATLEAVKPFLEASLSLLYRGGVRIVRDADPLVPFSVKITTGDRPTVAALLSRLPQPLPLL